ncbi:HAD family hydrolase [Acanthopleuribacter pedis]|uniref:HAD family hydrolase n=1 Tax=Acanthopleuribacter pedis TaxID=442870 RepID=A0A8J7U7K5_9BACT|nr:HAD family hydrolase [Acanthopleuribacter pedis]MBO1323099.1 HAD family hydrolase [Acanthopleuribacter pedis]
MAGLRYPTLIFDWDGTLIDSIPRIVRCFQESFRQLGLTPPADNAIQATIGLPIATALRQVAPNEAVLPELAALYRTIWRGDSVPQATLFDGVPDMLQTLKDAGYQLLIGTGKSRVGLEREMNNNGVAPFFSHSLCGDESFPKPDPRFLTELCRIAGVTPNICLMIGDSDLDMAMAEDVPMDAVAVTSGSVSRAVLMRHAPVACLALATELPAWLEPEPK